VAALTHISARSTTTTAEMAEDIVKRLVALGNAKELARPSTPQHREAIDLGELLAVLLAVYDDKRAIGDRIHVSVPPLMVGDASMTTLALVVHELATNSLKYGALSAATGKLTVNGVRDDSEITLIWTERGGPEVAVRRDHEGFGSKLIKRSIVDYLEGSISFDWPQDGVIVTMRVPQAALAA
jgi:two-component sensor histidine kinase